MAYFVTYHAEHFVVGHEVHQAGIYAHGAVGAGEGVDVLGDINLEIQRYAVDFGQSGGHAGEPHRVGA